MTLFAELNLRWLIVMAQSLRVDCFEELTKLWGLG